MSNKGSFGASPTTSVTNKFAHGARLTHQRGVILVTSLFILLLMTMLGITGVTTTSLEEKMAANLRDHYLAFQSAETSLLTGEKFAKGLIHMGDFDDEGSVGLYSIADPATQNRWETIDWEGGSNFVQVKSSLAGLYAQPKYIIEHLTDITGSTGSASVMVSGYGGYSGGSGATVYRVTSFATGGSANSKIMLQSTYADN
ncbi:MAG: hypothetical protein COB04_08045 [Gammaproteobacteria bacterium]|nr:MAG: hypothetical protein COB04_08045 [Gammaproteobacteria bacterium]